MIPAAFDYHRPTDVESALALLAEHGDGAKVLAGGQSLLPLMKLRLARPERVIDIGRLDDLRDMLITRDGGMKIGALATYADLLVSDAMGYAVLADALPDIGDVQVRNRGTIGGSIAHCDPASDMPACLLALEARVVARSQRGERMIDVGELFDGPFRTTLEADELLTEIRVPPLPRGTGSAYASLAQPASGYSLVGVAAVVGRGDGGAIDRAAIGVSGVGDTPYRAGAVEAAHTGSDGSADAIAAAASKVTEGVDVLGDIHADAAYRTAMAAVYARRAIEAALARAG
jgi:carbon-monoxide dehydrogenase medium subunit